MRWPSSAVPSFTVADPETVPTVGGVFVTGKLEIRGTVTGNVWFVADGGVVIKGDLWRGGWCVRVE